MPRAWYSAEQAAVSKVTGSSVTPPASAPHTALWARAGATARAAALLAPLLVVSGCSQLAFLRQAPDPVVVAAPVEPERPAWTAPTAESVAASDAAGVARLEAFAEVWQTVRWFHPDVVGRAGAWDTAYLRHVDAARTAGSDEAFIAAVHALLGELADPSTGVVPAEDRVSTASTASTAALNPRVLAAQTTDSVLVVRPIAFGTAREAAVQQRLFEQAMVDRVPRHAAVLDLRADSGGAGDQRWWVRALDAREWPRPEGTAAMTIRRMVVRDGRTALGESDDCCARWEVRTELAPSTGGATPMRGDMDGAAAAEAVVSPPAKLAVIVDDATLLPAALLARQATGHVVFISTGSGALRTHVATTVIPLVGGLVARVRTEELLLPDGRPVPTHADRVVSVGGTGSASPGTLQAPDTADVAIQAALQIVRSAGAATGNAVASVATAQPSRWAAAASGSATRATMPIDVIYPSHPERLLAVTKLWSAVRLFNPYLPMADESWDAMYREAIGEAERASSSRTYAAALFRFAAHTDASQVTLTVPDHPEFGRRAGQVPFRLRLVDRRALVAAIDDSAAQRAGVQVGDEVVSIGGEPIDKRLGRLRTLMPASNNWSRDQQLERWLESGPAPVKATFRVQRGTDAPRDLDFAYMARDDSSRAATAPAAGATGAATDAVAGAAADVRTARTVDSLGDGLWLVRPETHAPRTAAGAAGAVSPAAMRSEALPAALGTAEGVIVDARGVTSDVALRWLGGSVLDADGASYARDAVSELVGPPQAALRTPELDPARRFTWSARAAPVTPDAFAGPMVILVDATTRGDGELLALRLAAGGPNRIIMGTTTAGAVGDVRTMQLPGNVQVQLPVTDVRQPDGRFVQRLGVPPAMVVVPTVDGVRAGRDEQLQAARQWLQQRLAPPSRRR